MMLRRIFSPEKNRNAAKDNDNAKKPPVAASSGRKSPVDSSGATTTKTDAVEKSPSKRMRCGVVPANSGPVTQKVCYNQPDDEKLADAKLKDATVPATKKPAAKEPKPAAKEPKPAAKETKPPVAAVDCLPESSIKAASSLSQMMPDLSIRSRRLMKEFREIQRLMRQPNAVFSVSMCDDNLYEWHAHLHTVDPQSLLARDMRELNVPHIKLHLSFPDNFPFSPPFMRVVEPHIEKGYVMEGGAICMELLTPRGWASAYTVEALLMQFSASVVKGSGRIRRTTTAAKAFNQESAEMAFRSLVKTHNKYGWVTPSLSDG